jgi:serine/threonine protein kinase
MSVAIAITVGENRWDFTLQPGGAGVTIGRGSDVDISVNDASVSRRHCTIQLEASGLTVRDLASANGTSINGTRISATAPLRAGDALRAGKVDVKVEVQRKGSGSRRSPKVAPAPPPATDLVCESCGRLVTLSTVKDGQIVHWGDKILCPACKDASDTGTLEGLDSLVQLLAGEGFTVLNRISLANSYTPVFKARRTALNDLVAVKALPIVPGRTEKKLERFQTEARAMAQIHHPNVIRVYDVRVRPGFIYLVMEFVEGETLLRKLEREGKLPLASGLNMGLALARALETISKQGIVHRDVKPANIIVAKDGTAKLGDFGLSKDLLLVGGSHATGAHETLGTIRYMPPEQCLSAKDVDYRSDLYALAATLFHVLTGKLPYPAMSDVELLRAVVTRKPPSFDPTGTPGLPDPVARVLARALEGSPAGRHRSAQAFREDLGQAIAAVQAAGSPPPAPTTRTAPLTSSATVGVMSGTFGNEQLVELVQMLGVNQKSGFLALTWQGGEGQVAFKDGKIVAVRTSAGGKGAEGGLDLLTLQHGQFEFRPGVPANLKAEHTLGVEALLLEAMRRRDELAGP